MPEHVGSINIVSYRTASDAPSCSKRLEVDVFGAGSTLRYGSFARASVHARPTLGEWTDAGPS